MFNLVITLPDFNAGALWIKDAETALRLFSDYINDVNSGKLREVVFRNYDEKMVTIYRDLRSKIGEYAVITDTGIFLPKIHFHDFINKHKAIEYVETLDIKRYPNGAAKYYKYAAVYDMRTNKIIASVTNT